MTTPALRVDRRGAVVVLENQDPPRNRMTFEHMDELERAVIALRGDRSVRAVVITAAADEHFSVGMDLKQLMAGADDRGAFQAVLDQRLRAERAAVVRCTASADQREGMLAFLEKHRPQFTGEQQDRGVGRPRVGWP